MRPRLRFASAFILVLALIAAACGKSTGGGTTPPDNGTNPAPDSGKIIEGGTLRVAGDPGPDSLNPYVATSQTSYAFYQEMYPFLLEYNETYDDFRPDFATSWEVSDDGTTWTFHTRPDVKWSDGEPLTAKDVLFTFQMALLPASGWGGTIKHLKSVDAPDDNTFVAVYDEPVGNELSQLQQIFILPEHVWHDAAQQAIKDNNAKALKEVPDKAPWVAGGPWILSDYKKDESALFTLNPNWYGTKPHITSWGERFFENDEAKIAALKGGEVDLIAALPPTGAEPLKAAGFPIDESPGVEFHDIIFNSNPKRAEHPEIKDTQFRLAMEQATDRQRLIDTVMLGHATPGTSIVPPVTGQWYNSSLVPVPFDLEAANATLDAAGYKDTNGDGVRETPDGREMSYEVGTQNGQPGVNDVFEILREDWGKAGVKIAQKPLAYNALWDWNQSPINEKTGVGEYLNFDIILWDWVPLQDPDFILSVLLCDQLSVWSDTAYCDTSYDDMYAEQGVTVNPKDRKDIVWQMQDQLYRDKPYIIMYYLNALYAYSPKWSGFVPSPQGPINALNRDTLMNAHQVG